MGLLQKAYSDRARGVLFTVAILLLGLSLSVVSFLAGLHASGEVFRQSQSIGINCAFGDFC
jgi:hypothetical protein